MDDDAKNSPTHDPLWHLSDDGGKKLKIAAARVNWVNQTAFAPPLVAVGVKTDSGAYDIAKEAGGFALNMLG